MSIIQHRALMATHQYALTGLVMTPVRAENPSQCVQLHVQSVSDALG